MSCRVEVVADCGDVSGISRALYISDKDDPTWLSQCSVSLSSCGSLLGFAYRNRLCLLSAQWINSTESNAYIISWNGNLPAEASALLAVPICSSNLSSQNGADWICIIVGYRSGEVGFYTDTGHLLLTEKLDSKPVVNITCHTGCYGSDPDDVQVLFGSAVCVLTGSSLFQTLRYAKAQLARVQAGLISEYSLDGRNVLLRKWLFVEQDVINDAAIVGLELNNTYDHLLAASTFGGYDTWYRSVPPHNTLVLGAGARPYIGFHYALEGGTAPPLQDVARAVASKIKSALPGWLGGGTAKSATNSPESKVKEESLSMRSGIGDVQRHATSVVLSPDRCLAALTDNLGRIAVLHVHKGVLIRLFKGYRDSQCAFMQVFEQDSKRGPTLNNIKDTRKVTFLIIYNPKKGLIDIRLMQRGSRVATFTATKNGKLLYNTHGLVGSESNYSQKKLNLPAFPCILLDPDGKIKRFVIPFHNALEGKNSQRSKDLHILMELKNSLKQKMYEKEDLKVLILKTAKELISPDIRRHCLEIIIGNPDVSPGVTINCINLFKENLCNNDQLSPDDLKLKQFCESLEKITLFFMQVISESSFLENKEFKSENVVYDSQKTSENFDTSKNVTPSEVEESSDKDNFIRDFSLLENDTTVLKRLLELAQEITYKDVTTKVTFVDQRKSIFKDFVTAFDLDDAKEYIDMKNNIEGTRISNLANYVFKAIFTNVEVELSKLERMIEASQINPMVFVKLLMTYSMEMPLNEVTIDVVNRFIEILYYIVKVSKEANQIVYNEISPWWQKIRDVLVDMPCPLRTMIFAMVCRVVSQMVEQQSEKANVDEAWVSLTAENAKWSLLVGKLEDISILSIVLQFKGALKGKSLPKLKAIELEINLKYVYNRGKGSVSELIAKWLCSKGVTPESIHANEILQNENTTARDDVESMRPDDESGYLLTDSDRVCVEENSLIFKWLNVLKKQFPYSASTSNLIANMCWEYAASFQKDITDMELLNAVLSCLNNIANAHLCLGLCTLIWMTYIKDIFESTCRLVNKVGKLPKERLCLQDVGLKDTRIFMEHITRYLERFLYCAGKVNETNKTILVFEKIWDESIPALVEVAQGTDKINHSVLNVTYQIACVIYYQCYFNIKSPKPLNNLFDCDLPYIFGGVVLSDENRTDGNFRCLDGKVRGQRMKFLSKLVASALDLITCEHDAGREIMYQSAESWSWIEKIYALAEMWDIDSEFIRREQIIGLYKLGHDTLAEDLTATSQHPELLLEPLVYTCAQRLKRCVEVSDNVSNVLAALPPELAVYLQSLETDPTISANISLKSSASVLANVMCRVHNSKASSVHQHIRLAQSMVYGCDILQEFSSSHESYL